MNKSPDQKPNPGLASAERRVKPLARLLRCATALRVTAPIGCGSRRLVWPQGSLSARSHGPTRVAPPACMGPRSKSKAGNSTTPKEG